MIKAIILWASIGSLGVNILMVNNRLEEMNNTQQNMVNAITSLKETELARLKAEQLQVIIGECGNVSGTYDTEEGYKVKIHCDRKTK